MIQYKYFIPLIHNFHLESLLIKPKVLLFFSHTYFTDYQYILIIALSQTLIIVFHCYNNP